MTDRVIKMLETEKACVERQDRKPKCNRYCENCDLCMPIEEVIDGYNQAIESVKRLSEIETIINSAEQIIYEQYGAVIVEGYLDIYDLIKHKFRLWAVDKETK